VLACDIDPLATVAAAINAELNDVRLRTTTAPHIGKNEAWDLVLAADVTYEAELTRQVLGWLTELATGGSRIVIADPGRGYLETQRLRHLATYTTADDNDAHGNHSIETHLYEVPARCT
jgi:predicted nicotinamide N-methyase